MERLQKTGWQHIQAHNTFSKADLSSFHCFVLGSLLGRNLIDAAQGTIGIGLPFNPKGAANCWRRIGAFLLKKLAKAGNVCRTISLSKRAS
jgi:hypothetical protein